MKHPGFMYGDVRVYYIEEYALDNFAVPMLSLYYAPNFAKGAPFGDDAAVQAFIAENKPFCYLSYKEFRKDWEHERKAQ